MLIDKETKEINEWKIEKPYANKFLAVVKCPINNNLNIEVIANEYRSGKLDCVGINSENIPIIFRITKEEVIKWKRI